MNQEVADTPLGKDISEKTFRKGLLWLFVLGLVLRTGYLLEHAHSPSFAFPILDQMFYDTAAKMILAGADLHFLRGLRPLLYPVFLAAFYKLGGAYGPDLALLAQHFLGICSGLLVTLIGARLFRHRLSGLAGGFLYLLAPLPLCFEGELLVESSYVFLICLLLWLLLRAADLAGWKAAALWLLCGALMLLAAQERPNVLLFVAVFPVLAACRWRREGWPACWPLLGLAGAALMAAPWGFVNKMQSGRFQPLPAAAGVNLYLGNNRASDGMTLALSRRVNYNAAYEDSVEVWARQEYDSDLRHQGRLPETNPMAISKYWSDRALREIRAAPAAWLKLMARKCWLMFWNTEPPNNKNFAFLQTEFLWLRFLPVRWVVLLMLAPAGIWAAARRGNGDALLILMTFGLLYSASVVAFFVCDRYRYPLWPVMAVFAGGGALALIESLRGRHWPASLGIAASVAGMALLSLTNWVGATLPSFARDYSLRSMAWYQKGHFPEALADIDRSLALDPDDPAALHHRGNVLLALDRFDDARQAYERTLQISPEDGGVWNNYGVALESLGKTDESLAAYRRATQCNPPSRSAFLGLAFAQIRRGQLEAAADDLDQLEKQEKTPDAAASALRSVLARRRGETTQAEALERQARNLDAEAADWAVRRAEGGK